MTDRRGRTAAHVPIEQSSSEQVASYLDLPVFLIDSGRALVYLNEPTEPLLGLLSLLVWPVSRSGTGRAPLGGLTDVIVRPGRRRAFDRGLLDRVAKIGDVTPRTPIVADGGGAMDQSESDDLGVPADVATAVESANLVGAPTSEKDDEWAGARRGAIRVARAVGARLILADVSTRSFVWTPYASGQMAGDSAPLYGAGQRAVDREELERPGRHYLVEQLDEAAEVGVDAQVWLAPKPGVASLVMFLERFPIDVLVTPPFDHPSLSQRIHGDTLAQIRKRIADRSLILAYPDGRLSLDRGVPQN